MQTENQNTTLQVKLGYLYSLLASEHEEYLELVFTKLQELLDYLIFWENTHNIVSKKLSKESILDSIIDSVEGGIFLKNELDDFGESDEQIIDAGSGGGFPGIPLAIIFKNRFFCLVDSDRKKCSFLRFVKSKLDIKNIEIINDKLEKITPAETVITRAAFSPQHSQPLALALKKGGVLAIWATPETSSSFEYYLNQAGMIISARKDYEIGEERKKRCVLLFRAAN